MTDPLRGRYANLKKNGSTIANFSSWTLAITLDELPFAPFGSSAWKKNMSGMQGYTVTMEGFYTPSDTPQGAIKTAALAGTKLTDIQLFVDSTSKWVADTTTDPDAGLFIVGHDVNMEASGLARLTVRATGYGPIALI